jgi:hypothetical protein
MENMREYWAREAEMMRDKSAVLGTSNKGNTETGNFLKADPPGKFYVYFTNDSEYMLYGNDYSAKLSEVMKYAKRILEKNGLTGLIFKEVNPSIAKKYPRTDEWHLFLAVVCKVQGYDPGSSDLSAQNGLIGIYGNSEPKEKWNSYVNHYFGINAGITGDSLDYYTGYLAAHEILHQLLYRASCYLDNKWDKFSHEGSENLNTVGSIAASKIPKLPLRDNMSLRAIETILPEHKSYINRFFQAILKK